MKRPLRILIISVLSIALVGVLIYWGAPIALSFYAARKALPVTKIAPVELGDTAISQGPDTKSSTTLDGLTQRDINRVVQTAHRATLPTAVAAAK